MDIQDLTIEQIKALCYDAHIERQRAEQTLRILEDELTRRANLPKRGRPKKKDGAEDGVV